jgi:hypothetical protein
MRRRNRNAAPSLPGHNFTALEDRGSILNFIDRIALLL